ncbi:MAG: hypothetical protein ABEI86_08170 [Halobacteriaceae archaeon]
MATEVRNLVVEEGNKSQFEFIGIDTKEDALLQSRFVPLTATL